MDVHIASFFSDGLSHTWALNVKLGPVPGLGPSEKVELGLQRAFDFYSQHKNSNLFGPFSKSWAQALIESSPSQNVKPECSRKNWAPSWGPDPSLDFLTEKRIYTQQCNVSYKCIKQTLAPRLKWFEKFKNFVFSFRLT